MSEFECLDSEYYIDARVLYWAAYCGVLEPIRFAIEKLKISPSTQCFEKKNWLIAAIELEQIDMIRYLLQYNYTVEY